MYMKKLLLEMTIICMSACSARMSSEAVKDNIRETVLRHEFHSQMTNCIMIENDKDASDALIERFKNQTPPVKKGSACEWAPVSGDPIGRAVDRASGSDAIIVTFMPIRILSSHR